MSQVSERLTPSAALELLAQQEQPRFVQMLQHGSMAVEMYRPIGVDRQKPHQQDELYVIVSGHGILFDGTRRPFAPGEVLFVPAGREHRFEQFDEDFATWVFLYGPDGGEASTSG